MCDQLDVLLLTSRAGLRLAHRRASGQDWKAGNRGSSVEKCAEALEFGAAAIVRLFVLFRLRVTHGDRPLCTPTGPVHGGLITRTCAEEMSLFFFVGFSPAPVLATVSSPHLRQNASNISF